MYIDNYSGGGSLCRNRGVVRARDCESDIYNRLVRIVNHIRRNRSRWLANRSLPGRIVHSCQASIGARCVSMIKLALINLVRHKRRIKNAILGNGGTGRGLCCSRVVACVLALPNVSRRIRWQNIAKLSIAHSITKRGNTGSDVEYGGRSLYHYARANYCNTEW